MQKRPQPHRLPESRQDATWNLVLDSGFRLPAHFDRVALLRLHNVLLSDPNDLQQRFLRGHRQLGLGQRPLLGGYFEAGKINLPLL